MHWNLRQPDAVAWTRSWRRIVRTPRKLQAFTAASRRSPAERQCRLDSPLSSLTSVSVVFDVFHSWDRRHLNKLHHASVLVSEDVAVQDERARGNRRIGNVSALCPALSQFRSLGRRRSSRSI